MMIFVITNIILVIAHIHKHALLVKLSYQQQRYEKEKNELLVQRNNLVNQQYALTALAQMKKKAAQELGMVPIKMSQVKKITLNE